MEQELNTNTSLDPAADGPIDVTDFFKRAVWHTKIANGRDRYDSIKSGLQVALGSAMVKLTGNDQFLEYYVDKDDDVPVALLQLIRDLPAMQGLSAVLGMDRDDTPILLDLAAPDSTHLMIAGETDAGKTMLLRSILMSLALKQRQANLQLVLVDGGSDEGVGLNILSELPHVIGPVVSEIPQVAETLDFLVGEMMYRQEQGVRTPALVLAIDEVEPLLSEGGQPMVAPLMRLLQQGAASGIHVILTTDSPASPILDSVLKASLPLRLVGRVANADEARAAAGIAESQAEYLQGYGDFVAILGDSLTNFQAAYIGDTACRRTIKRMLANDKGKLLAFPIDPVTGQVIEPSEPESVAEAEPTVEVEPAAMVDSEEDELWDEDEDDELETDLSQPEEVAEISSTDILDADIWLDDDDEDESEDELMEDDEDLNPVTLAGIVIPRQEHILPRIVKDSDYVFAYDEADEDDQSAPEQDETSNLAESSTEEDLDDWAPAAELEYEDDDEYVAGKTIYDDDDEIPFE